MAKQNKYAALQDLQLKKKEILEVLLSDFPKNMWWQWNQPWIKWRGSRIWPTKNTFHGETGTRCPQCNFTGQLSQKPTLPRSLFWWYDQCYQLKMSSQIFIFKNGWNQHHKVQSITCRHRSPHDQRTNSTNQWIIRSQPRSIAQRRKINPISDLSTMKLRGIN